MAKKDPKTLTGQQMEGKMTDEEEFHTKLYWSQYLSNTYIKHHQCSLSGKVLDPDLYKFSELASEKHARYTAVLLGQVGPELATRQLNIIYNSPI